MSAADQSVEFTAASAAMSVAPLAETLILPYRGWFDWRLRQLWHYRDLITVFVWRDFVSVYKQTILGPLWHLVKPLFTTVTFTIVFSGLAGLSTDGAPPFLFYLVGNVAWTYFATCLDNIAKTLITHSGLMGKVYFHRLVIPISLVLSNLIAFGIQFGILLVTMGIYYAIGTRLHPTAWVFMLPVLLFILAGFTLGGGLLVCAATTRYRDLSYLVTFGVQLLMYLSPVIYPVSEIPPSHRWAAQLNPLTPVFEGFRKALLGVGTVTVSQVAISFALMLVILVAGITIFSRAERTFMDTV